MGGRRGAWGGGKDREKRERVTDRTSGRGQPSRGEGMCRSGSFRGESRSPAGPGVRSGVFRRRP